MGKKAKEHRKKVQLRNQNLKVQQKKLMAELQNEFQTQMATQQAQMAERQKTMKSLNPQHVYASTGDFVAKNYEEIFQKGGQHAAQSLIESTDEGPRFS